MELKTLEAFDEQIESNIEMAMQIVMDEGYKKEDRDAALRVFEMYYDRYHKEIDRRNYWGLEEMKYELEKYKTEREIEIETLRREDERYRIERELEIAVHRAENDDKNQKLSILGRIGEGLIKGLCDGMFGLWKAERAEKQKNERLERVLTFEKDNVVSGIGRNIVNDSVK